ncbi:MAG: peptide deformylase [Candidatus Omnitrophota bacterium]|nr:peptide deformylase [Candidatus Omnitrophota bacterium]MBU2528274.1 peptide deformylase [bacterium]MBU3929651.1 peptide deformylase [bacterium]MBU4122135.1 peptide deformylase [bacterium]
MVEQITIYGAPVLRELAEEIKNVGELVRNMLRDLAETMAENSGIGLAAPQVGIALRAAVINTTGREEDLICVVNPVIEASSGKARIKEGCLSIPGIFENVKRPAFVRVRAMDIDGNERIIEAGGMEARVLQHEIDHLDGILFTDRIPVYRKIFICKALRRLKAGRK